MISVIVRSKDEADRLRLCIASVLGQLDGHQLIVVNDGSSDHTDAVINEAMTWGEFSVIKHEKPLGRSAASNAGVEIANGDLLLFLDGDVLASPNLLALHEKYHQQSPNTLARGENRHLRCTRALLNPELATPFPVFIEEFSTRSTLELERLRVTLDQIHHDFDSIEKRSGLSIYLGIQPQILYHLEVNAIVNSPDCSVLWAAASGHNSSVSRKQFISVNGFDEQIDINEQRELALKLSKTGVRMGHVPGAKTYHMIHQSAWRNPIVMSAWERRFLSLHPMRAVALLNIFWGTLADAEKIPPEFRIYDLIELESAAINRRKLNYDEARGALGLESLGSAFWLAGIG